MDIKTKEMYSEIYSILGLMEEKYVNRLPAKLYNLIQDNRLENYNPVYDPLESLANQNIKKETATMLVLLKLNYWCDSEEEKDEIREALKKNSENLEKIMREQYSSANMFKHLNRENEVQENVEKTKNEMTEYSEEGFFKKLLRKIARLINKNS